MPLTIWNFVCHKSDICGNKAIIWHKLFATRYVSFATTLYTK